MTLCCHSWWLCSFLKPFFCSKSILEEPSNICSLFPACHTIILQGEEFYFLSHQNTIKIKTEAILTARLEQVSATSADQWGPAGAPEGASITSGGTSPSGVRSNTQEIIQ